VFAQFSCRGGFHSSITTASPTRKGCVHSAHRLPSNRSSSVRVRVVEVMGASHTQTVGPISRAYKGVGKPRQNRPSHFTRKGEPSGEGFRARASSAPPGGPSGQREVIPWDDSTRTASGRPGPRPLMGDHRRPRHTRRPRTQHPTRSRFVTVPHSVTTQRSCRR
jgi:hypothetical protein